MSKHFYLIKNNLNNVRNHVQKMYKKVYKCKSTEIAKDIMGQ